MIIEGIRIDRDSSGPDAQGTCSGIAEPGHAEIEEICGRGPWETTHGAVDLRRMLDAEEAEHDPYVASILCAASTWAYSDVDTFARAIHCRGPMSGLETVCVKNVNPALFEHTIGYIVQAHDRRLGILCFRGTETEDAVRSMINPYDLQEPFLTIGHVHGGLYRSVLALWPILEMLLKYACKGYSICDAAARAKARARRCVDETLQRSEGARYVNDGGAEMDDRMRGLPPPTNEDEDVLEALYITGHGMGGALAVLVAALIDMSPSLQFASKKLRGIYTFGQPMVGDAHFAQVFAKRLGSKLFRHVMMGDTFAYLPGEAMYYSHFGRIYINGEGGWASERNDPAVTALISILWSALMSSFRLLRLPLPSFIHQVYLSSQNLQLNSPLHYLRVSQRVAPGAEFF